MSRKSANWQVWAEMVQTGHDGCYRTGHENEGLAWNNELLKRGKIVILHGCMNRNQYPLLKRIANMADDQKDDPEISSLKAHLDGKPPQTIVMTLGQEAVYVKPHIIAIMPVFLGMSCDSPYEFLHEFCEICIARKPVGSSEDDYRLKALPFALKGEAHTWFMRLPPNSIRTWSNFKMMFLDQFFSAAKTSALRKEIRGTTHGYDETLNQYLSRYMGLLEACPTHHVLEIEIYSIFHEGMNKKSKDLVNSSSGGSFSKLRVSKAKRIIERLLYAKRAYDNPRALLPRRSITNAAAVRNDDQLEVGLRSSRGHFCRQLRRLIRKLLQSRPPQ